MYYSNLNDTLYSDPTRFKAQPNSIQTAQMLYKSYNKHAAKRKKPFNRLKAVKRLYNKPSIRRLKQALGLNTESKFVDTTQSGYALTTTATLLSYASAIPQGDGPSARNGADVRMTSFIHKGLLTTATATAIPHRVRIVAYVQPVCLASTQLTAAQILQDPSSIISPYNMDTEGYNVIYDKTFTLGLASADNATVPYLISYHPTSHHIKWLNTDTTGAAAATVSGYIRVFAYTDVATTPPTLQSYTRLKYVDN